MHTSTGFRLLQGPLLSNDVMVGLPLVTLLLKYTSAILAILDV
jgi:hypothetical protein